MTIVIKISGSSGTGKTPYAHKMSKNLEAVGKSVLIIDHCLFDSSTVDLGLDEFLERGLKRAELNKNDFVIFCITKPVSSPLSIVFGKYPDGMDAIDCLGSPYSESRNKAS